MSAKEGPGRPARSYGRTMFMPTGPVRQKTCRRPAATAGRPAARRRGVVAALRRRPVTLGSALAAALALVAASPAPGASWRRPVPGAVTRPFSYARDAPFVAGRHRGVDFAARRGSVVRAACGG